MQNNGSSDGFLKGFGPLFYLLWGIQGIWLVAWP